MKRIYGTGLKREITLDDIRDAEGSEITLSACVHKLRSMGGFTLMLLRTGRYILQSVFTRENCKGNYDALTEGAYVSVTGTVKKEERADCGYEITLSAFEILSSPKEEYPLPVSSRHLGCSIETNMEHRSAALRHPEQRSVFKVSEGIVTAFRGFMLKEGFTEIHTPKIVSTASENKTNIFKLKYFGKNAYLSQSPQPYKQAGVAFFDRVFETAPVYRAEMHNSQRHLNEFVSLDFEMAYIDDIGDVMAVETAMLRYVMKYLSEHYGHELSMLGASLPVIDSIPTVTFREALDILGKTRQLDLDPTDEIKLCRWALEKHECEFIFVEKFPIKKRPFYVMNSHDDPSLTESFDLLFRGMEIATGGQRVHDYDEQLAKLKSFKLNPQDFVEYLDIHRYGMPPHGGSAIGLERLVMKLLNLDNIRQASLFPRDLHHLKP